MCIMCCIVYIYCTLVYVVLAYVSMFDSIIIICAMHLHSYYVLVVY